MEDKKRGLYNKFEVKRTDGRSEPGEKHDGCRYFVIDLDHDEFAAGAIKKYSELCESKYPALSADLKDMSIQIILSKTTLFSD